MMEDRFLENDPAPLFLAGPFEEAEQSTLRKIVSSDGFRRAVLAFAAAATLFAVAWVVNAIVFARVTASEATARAPRDGGGQLAPTMQSNSNAQANDNAQVNDTAQVVPTTQPGDQLLAAFKAAVETKAPAETKAPIETKAAIETKADVDQVGSETLLKQFKAWASEENVQEAPAAQPEPTPAAQSAQAEAVQPARAEIVPLPRRRPPHVEQAARAHDAASQNAPSLLRQLGLR